MSGDGSNGTKEDVPENVIEKCRIYGTVPSGFEFTAVDECKERFGNDLADVFTERGAVKFTIPVARAAETLKLRSVDHLFVVLLEFKKTFSENKEEALQQIRDIITQKAEWIIGFRVWKTATLLLSPAKNHIDIPKAFCESNLYIPSFRATCYRSGTHVFTSQEAMVEFGGEVNNLFGWKVDLKHYDVEVVLIVDSDRVSISLSMTQEPMFRRNMAELGPTTLRATIAYNMIRLGAPQPGDILCDPMCGSGSIPIEAAVAFPNSYVLCGDNHPSAPKRTELNVAELGKKMGRPLNNIGSLDLDVVSFPLRPNSVDLWVSDFPFGKRHKCNRWELYPKALAAMANSSKPGVSRAVILTKDRNAMMNAIRSSNFWSIKRMVSVNIGGLTACVYLLARTCCTSG